MRKLSRGILIAIEGIDGSGKTTLAGNLAQDFTNYGLSVVPTKEPGGSQLGKSIRALISQGIPLCAQAEYLLFAADRAQHMHEVILPAINEHKIVISDRFSDSSLVYQGFGRLLDKEYIKTINAWTTNNLKPDITLFVSLDALTAQKRVHQRKEPLSVFETEHITFTQRLIQGFEIIFNKRTDVIRLDGKLSAEELKKQAFTTIMDQLSPLLV